MHLFGEVRCEVPGSTSGLAEMKRWGGSPARCAQEVCVRGLHSRGFTPEPFLSAMLLVSAQQEGCRYPMPL